MYKLSARQIIVVALISGLFAAGAVAVVDRFSNRLQTSSFALSENAPAGLTDPATASDEQNNIEIYRTLSPGVVTFTQPPTLATSSVWSNRRKVRVPDRLSIRRETFLPTTT